MLYTVRNPHLQLYRIIACKFIRNMISQFNDTLEYLLNIILLCIMNSFFIIDLFPILNPIYILNLGLLSILLFNIMGINIGVIGTCLKPIKTKAEPLPFGSTFSFHFRGLRYKKDTVLNLLLFVLDTYLFSLSIPLQHKHPIPQLRHACIHQASHGKRYPIP